MTGVSDYINYKLNKIDEYTYKSNEYFKHQLFMELVGGATLLENKPFTNSAINRMNDELNKLYGRNEIKKLPAEAQNTIKAELNAFLSALDGLAIKVTNEFKLILEDLMAKIKAEEEIINEESKKRNPNDAASQAELSAKERLNEYKNLFLNGRTFVNRLEADAMDRYKDKSDLTFLRNKIGGNLYYNKYNNKRQKAISLVYDINSSINNSIKYNKLNNYLGGAVKSPEELGKELDNAILKFVTNSTLEMHQKLNIYNNLLYYLRDPTMVDELIGDILGKSTPASKEAIAIINKEIDGYIFAINEVIKQITAVSGEYKLNSKTGKMELQNAPDFEKNKGLVNRYKDFNDLIAELNEFKKKYNKFDPNFSYKSVDTSRPSSTINPNLPGPSGVDSTTKLTPEQKQDLKARRAAQKTVKQDDARRALEETQRTQQAEANLRNEQRESRNVAKKITNQAIYSNLSPEEQANLRAENIAKQEKQKKDSETRRQERVTKQTAQTVKGSEKGARLEATRANSPKDNAAKKEYVTKAKSLIPNTQDIKAEIARFDKSIQSENLSEEISKSLDAKVSNVAKIVNSYENGIKSLKIISGEIPTKAKDGKMINTNINDIDLAEFKKRYDILKTDVDNINKLIGEIKTTLAKGKGKATSQDRWATAKVGTMNNSPNTQAGPSRRQQLAQLVPTAPKAGPSQIRASNPVVPAGPLPPARRSLTRGDSLVPPSSRPEASLARSKSSLGGGKKKSSRKVSKKTRKSSKKSKY